VDQTGAAKLLVTSRALRLRRDRPDLFTGYTPLSATGPAAAHLVAIDRGGAIGLATRLPHRLERSGGWAGTALDLPAGVWVDVLTGRPAVPAVGELLADYPVALLVRSP
jgi:(1->4)-alpha-D-glucan 1-alpha-D-glucosylmutase